MLRCSKCNHVYQDDSQKFCTRDGARVLSADDNVKPLPSHKLPRRTPPGELLLETFISPSDDLSFGGINQLNRKPTPSFQSFGLHSSHTSDSKREVKTTNGFHSFDSLIVDNKEAKTGKTRIGSNSDATETARKSLIHITGDNQTTRVNTSLIIICLLSVLLVLTILAVAATYFFREQGQTPARSFPEISFINKSTAGKKALSRREYFSHVG